MRSAERRFSDDRAISAADAEAPSGERFVTPEEFSEYAAIGAAKGFLLVSASPLTRSSHHAGDDFARLRAARAASLGEGG